MADGMTLSRAVLFLCVNQATWLLTTIMGTLTFVVNCGSGLATLDARRLGLKYIKITRMNAFGFDKH